MLTNEVATVPLFRNAPRSRRAELAKFADRVTVPAGNVLARQGDIAHEFFVIVDGIADVIRDGQYVERLGPGDFFGEIALVGNPYRTATVVAVSDLDVAVMPRREFRSMLAQFPDIAATILMAASRRIVGDLRENERAHRSNPGVAPVSLGTSGQPR